MAPIRNTAPAIAWKMRREALSAEPNAARATRPAPITRLPTRSLEFMTGLIFNEFSGLADQGDG